MMMTAAQIMTQDVVTIRGFATVADAVAVEAPAALGTNVIVATPRLLVSAVPDEGLKVPSDPAENVTTSLIAAPPVWLTVAVSV